MRAGRRYHFPWSCSGALALSIDHTDPVLFHDCITRLGPKREQIALATLAKVAGPVLALKNTQRAAA